MAVAKHVLRARRKNRIRARISGTALRPRLSVFRSNTAIFAQLIDDEAGKTVASSLVKKGNVEGSKEAAKKIAEKYSGPCVFDRNGFAYHGRVKAFADAAREAGLQF